jgi:LPXTG-motif cell wall-anchored protein
MTHSVKAKRRPLLVSALAAMALVATTAIAVPTAANATEGGSDGVLLYSLTNEGVQLQSDDAFIDGGHINLRLTNGTSPSIHFEDRNWPLDHPKRAYIGKTLFPWTAFKDDQGNPLIKVGDCVEWAQLHTIKVRNGHYGEGGQPPFCIGTGEEEPEEPPTAPDPKIRTEVIKKDPVCLPEGGGTVEKTTLTYKSEPVWNADKKDYDFGPETVIDTKVETEPATAEECPAPPQPPVKPDPKKKTEIRTDAPVCLPEGGAGTVTSYTDFYEKHPTTWDADKKKWLFGDWQKVDTTSETRPATAEECPVVIPPKPDPEKKVTVKESDPICDPKGESVVFVTTSTWLREPTTWNAEAQAYDFGPWEVIESRLVVRPATAEECPVPPVVDPPKEEEPPAGTDKEDDTPGKVVKPAANLTTTDVLPATGGELPYGALAGGILVLLAGATIYLLQRRRSTP